MESPHKEEASPKIYIKIINKFLVSYTLGLLQMTSVNYAQ